MGPLDWVECLLTILFLDEDIYTNVVGQNRPHLFLESSRINLSPKLWWMNKPISQVLVVDGSLTNNIPIGTLLSVELTVGHLKPTILVMQGFNGSKQRSLGKISIRTCFNEVDDFMDFPIIDFVRYNAQLGQPWKHMNAAASFTFH